MPRGFAPKDDKVGRTPVTHEWQHAQGHGWRFGEVPKPPEGLCLRSLRAWDGWFNSWVAAFWSPEDVPELENVIELFDKVATGSQSYHSELRLALDAFGISYKGQQERRWRPPTEEAPKKATTRKGYNHLHAVGE